jgi:hypothetical protein
MSKGVSFRSYTEGQSRRSTFKGSQCNIGCTAGERFGPTFVSSGCKYPYGNDKDRQGHKNMCYSLLPMRK